jgi:putative MATE family efflux protein
MQLAIPAFLALIAEPLFLLADSAIVGHLGTPALAGLGIAGAVMATFVSMCIFLAYGTTASVAQLMGAGRLGDALRQGIDGVWLAVLIGLVCTPIVVILAHPLVLLFGAQPDVVDEAVAYLRVAGFGILPLLVMLAATGVLRGLQDTKTPLYVAVAGNVLNVVLNVVLVYGLGLGIAGSAIGSVIAQVLSAVWLVWAVVAFGRRSLGSDGLPLRPRGSGIRLAGRSGMPLLLRTLTLRACLLLMTFGAASLGTVEVATTQLAMTIWTFLAFALDAIAIAAQAIIGEYVGAGDHEARHQATWLMIRWGFGFGIITGLGLALLSPVLGIPFTPDPEVRSALTGVLLIAALGQPIAGVVFVLDGVLIGAGEGRYLAVAGLIVLAVFAPFVWLAVGVVHSLAWLWVAFVVAFMGSRCVVLLRRA